MTQRKAFLTKEQSLMLRGIAIFLVLISHYAVWIGEIFHSDLLEYGLGRFGVYGVDLFFAVSGYGLVKSVGKKRINGTFLWKRFKTVYLPYLLIVGLIYWIEILSVMIQVTYFKKTGGKRIFKMAPIHHHFELCGWSETRVVAVFSIITAILCMIGLLAL